jgi:hypothetical protein
MISSLLHLRTIQFKQVYLIKLHLSQNYGSDLQHITNTYLETLNVLGLVTCYLIPKTAGIPTKISILFVNNGDTGIEFLSRFLKNRFSLSDLTISVN